MREWELEKERKVEGIKIQKDREERQKRHGRTKTEEISRELGLFRYKCVQVYCIYKYNCISKEASFAASASVATCSVGDRQRAHQEGY